MDTPGVADALAPAWDAAAVAAGGLDEFCASSDWAFAAALSFPNAGPPELFEGVDGAWVGLRRVMSGDGARVLVGLDPSWGFGSPVVGSPLAAAGATSDALRACQAVSPWDVAAISGQTRGAPLTEAVISALSPDHAMFVGPEEHRMQADLAGGLEEWWAARSTRFRQRMRRIESEASEAGVAISLSDAAPAEMVGRAVAIEAGGWKGAAATGLSSETMAAFAAGVLGRLAPTGRGRMWVARRDGEDVGYLMGGIRGSTFRGLQLGHTSGAATLGVGHLLQMHAIRAAAADGLLTYDLGMHMPYKQRWADRTATTFTLIVRRS